MICSFGRLVPLASIALSLAGIAPVQAAPETHDLGTVQVRLDRGSDDYEPSLVDFDAWVACRECGETGSGAGLFPDEFLISTPATNQLRIDFASDFPFAAYAYAGLDGGYDGVVGAKLPLFFTAEPGVRIVGYRLSLGVESEVFLGPDKRDRSGDVRLHGGFHVRSGEESVSLFSVDRTYTRTAGTWTEVLTASLSADADLSSLQGSFEGISSTYGYNRSQFVVNYLSVETLTAPVPEPQTWALLLAGLCVTGAMANRRRRQPR